MTREEYLERLRKHIEKELREERAWSAYKKEVQTATTIGELIDLFIFDYMGVDNSKDAIDAVAVLFIRLDVSDFRMEELA